MSAALISVATFHAVYWPLKQRTLSMRAYRIVIFIAWILSAILTCIEFFVSISFVPFLLPIALLFIVSYLNIGIWRKFQDGTIGTQQTRDSQKKTLEQNLVVCISHCFAIVGPFHCCSLFNICLRYIKTLACCWDRGFCYSNSFLNPVVYALRISEYRQALVFCRHWLIWKLLEGLSYN